MYCLKQVIQLALVDLQMSGAEIYNIVIKTVQLWQLLIPITTSIGIIAITVKFHSCSKVYQ